MSKKRDYDNVSQAIKDNYRLARINQTYSYVNKMCQRFSKIDRCESIWNILENLNDFIDISDPDTTFPNMIHALQTAEMIRKDGHPEWLQIVGLIHDIGKIMYLKGDDQTGTSINKQWGIVGDTFIVGCKLPDNIVFPEFNEIHGDSDNSKLQTHKGIYSEGCGLDNVICSWGHDEYLYRLLTHERNRNSLPEEALYIIRYHSLYPYHQHGEYKHFQSDKDKDMFKWLKLFNKYDLYSKTDEPIDIKKTKEYYIPLIKKFFYNSQLFF